MEQEYGVDPNLECPICGTTEFFENGGFFFCAMCNTQSQQSRVFVEEDSFTTGGPQYVSRVAILDDGTTPQKEKDSTYRLSSWEVYNLVLKALTDKLIDMGYPDILKEKVFQLYAAYLVKRGAIFVSQKEDKKSCITKNEPVLNTYALYDEKPPPRKPRGIKRLTKLTKRRNDYDPTISLAAMKRRKTLAKRKAFQEEYFETLSQTIIGQQDNLYEELEIDYFNSDTNKPTTTTKGKPSITKKYNYSDGLKTISRAGGGAVPAPKILDAVLNHSKHATVNYRISQVLRPEAFSLTTVLTLLFVALRQIGCKVIFSDIFRMFQNGTLYMDKIRNLIEENELRHLDQDCSVFINPKFHPHDLSPSHRWIEPLIMYLGIKNFPYPSYKEIIPKFICDLVLPRQFEYLVNRLIEQADMINYHKVYSMESLYWNPLPELCILPMMITILKLLFGLDDVTEIYQSRFAKLVNKVVKKEQEQNGGQLSLETRTILGLDTVWEDLFVIKDWFYYSQYRETFIAYETKSPTTSGTSQINPTLSNIQHSIERYGGKEPESLSSPSRIAGCNGIKSLFENVSKKLNNGQDICKLPDYRAPSLCKQDVVQKYIESYPNVSHPSFNIDELKKYCKYFLNTRVDFIYNPDKYVRILERVGYNVEVITGDAKDYKRTLNKEKTIPLFQPYKNFDLFIRKRLLLLQQQQQQQPENEKEGDDEEYVGDCYDSLERVISYCTSMVGWNVENGKKFFRRLVQKYGIHLNKQAKKLFREM